MIRALLELLNRLLDALDVYLRRRRATEHQADRDNLEADPESWYRDHFGGVRDDASEQPGTGADQAHADDPHQSK